MLTEIRIYFEGDKQLRSGFRHFLDQVFERARAHRCRVCLISAGGTPARDFEIAMRDHPNAWNILLLDSEGPDNGRLTVSLMEEHGWDNCNHDSIFWMVQMMESWFHADKDAVEGYYGSGFKKAALKPNANVEQIPKKDLEDGLKAATRETKKGEYHKVKHGPGILEKIDPARVRQAAPNCRRLFEVILAQL